LMKLKMGISRSQ